MLIKVILMSMKLKIQKPHKNLKFKYVQGKTPRIEKVVPYVE